MIHFNITAYSVCVPSMLYKGVFKGGGVRPPKFSDFFWKSEEKEVEKKERKKQ